MPASVVVSFGHVHGTRAREVMGTLATLLALVHDDLEGCNAGYSRDSQGLLAVMHLAAPRSAVAATRLAFWSARAGGVALLLSQATASTRANVTAALDGADAKVSLAPDHATEGLAVLAAATGMDEPVERPGPLPTLVVSAGGPRWEATTYDPTTRRLFVPSSLAPPVGDRFELRIEGEPGEGRFASGTVCTAAVRDPFEPPEAGPEGFVVDVEEGRGLHAFLAESRGPGAASGRRAGLDGCARNMRVDLDAPLPSGATQEAAVTVRAEPPPRVLVVDDDTLARAMLADALSGRGFGVVAEQGALAGLLRLAEEIFTLDVLVTDVVMPEVDGGELVRRIRQVGGERDLPIVAITASEDPSVAVRLRACGADAVLAKRLGPEGIADAVVKLHRDVRARRAGSSEPARTWS
ncbi:response regulator receiver protein [Anaeromyxobacter sp. K]|uniref:response regulator n=1 Tax=Anaeromyxobacter sp. (strain K) TaxID=447217 RepID=UPI00017BE259|nr:response regulator [Anaeromyxobacter sp. K]ACG72648.1 response regulator receiver protein [Anaeromyxobacter sp. K]